MTHTLTIAGKQFTVEPRYAEGHVLTANEASALNQTYFENLRNNFAGKSKEGADQAAFDEYVSAYDFGVRTGGGRSGDPVQVEAMSLARDAVKKGLQAAGKKISDYSAAAITKAAEKLLEKKPEYMETARKRVEEMRSMAGNEIDDDLIATLDAAKAEEPVTADEGGTEPEGEEATAEGGKRRSKAAAE